MSFAANAKTDVASSGGIAVKVFSVSSTHVAFFPALHGHVGLPVRREHLHDYTKMSDLLA